MLLTSVIVSLLAWLTHSTPIFFVEERFNKIIIIHRTMIDTRAMILRMALSITESGQIPHYLVIVLLYP